MKMSAEGLDKLKEWEGCVLHPYKDAAGLLTIGVGHLIQPSETFGTITLDHALDILANDLIRFEEAVNKYVTVPLEQNQFDALVSFAFNVGVGAFKSSTLLKKLNVGFYESIPDQMLRWTKAGGKKLDGLVTRRKNEIELWNA